ncbi:DNA-binding protein [Methylobacterium gnaphalii]|uniref:Uncharacterized protein n=1 Tax=Methylobacterium gnaphalii TaxID=1010610 RepID=A0A512JMJ4_9HYPH|nr:DNA-binding protein [Methylobacterium gnaphalii]GEP11196.1 hypothetical protein MGN01_30410 [Methylobacterium gnaphalii]GJD70065.1 hypothetical protein MMMDOFMJ_3005 [Methylobacterium gnaphalii]GLS49701.1 hypothetical protein GCM10007885_25510 [Methylobacterium gnaphalii]
MTRNRGRRSFTVAAKSSGQSGFVTIPVKAPRVPQAARQAAAPATSAVFSEPVSATAPPADVTPRRILPSLIAWEAPAPEPEAVFTPEPPLPRVRRVTPQGALDDAPRRRGRPRKRPLPVDMAPTVMHEPEPAPAAPVVSPVAQPTPATAARRRDQPDGTRLRLGERWKRRLPRACW